MCIDRPAEVVDSLIQKIKITFYDELNNFEFTTNDYKHILRAILSELVLLGIRTGEEIGIILQSHQLRSEYLGK